MERQAPDYAILDEGLDFTALLLDARDTIDKALARAQRQNALMEQHATTRRKERLTKAVTR